MKRIFERKEPDESISQDKIIEKIKVGVLGCGRASGASFTATSIAYYAAQLTERNVAFVQLDGNEGCCDVYDALGMDKRFAGRTFNDIICMVREGKSIRGVRNLDEKVNWAVEIPEKLLVKKTSSLTLNDKEESSNPRTSDTIEKMRLINNISGDFIVCDFGSETGNDTKPLLHDMDYIICVIDPLPSKLLGNAGSITMMKSLEMRGHNVIWIINKDNGGVNRRELRDFLGNAGPGRYRKIPYIDERLFYSCQYNCEIPASNREIMKQIEPFFAEIISGILEQKI